MTTQLEAMKMMVEALEYYSGLHRPETDSALAAGRAAIEAAEKVEPDVDAATILRLLNTIKYMYGIAERGRGYKCPDNVMPERFLLEYVIELESNNPPSAEIEELRRDAARYRWIRKCMPFSTLKNITKQYLKNVPNDAVEEQLDAAIDAILEKHP